MKFSIVVPSFNQARYLGDCLDSILSQRGVALEVIVMDGGSTDGSADIIRRYEPYLAYWQSQPDGGQSAALNAGFSRATGDVFAWLCSDDLYLPGTLERVANAFRETGADLVTGQCIAFREGSESETLMIQAKDLDKTSLRYADHVPQPSTWWTRETWQKLGPLDESLHYIMDWEWFLRAENQGCKWAYLDRVCSLFRIHEGHKTGTNSERSREEYRRFWLGNLTPQELSAAQRVLKRGASSFETARTAKAIGGAGRSKLLDLVWGPVVRWHKWPGNPQDFKRLLAAAYGRVRPDDLDPSNKGSHESANQEPG